MSAVVVLLLPDDWKLPDWTHLSEAGKKLLQLLDRAGSPDRLLVQLQNGMERLKAMQCAHGGRNFAELSEFEEGYKRLQVRRLCLGLHAVVG